MKNRQNSAARASTLESTVVVNAFIAFVWNIAESTVSLGGGQAPFCASEAMQRDGVCVISDASSILMKPKSDTEMKPMRTTAANTFIP